MRNKKIVTRLNKKYIFVFIILLTQFFLYGQNYQTTIDSLVMVLQNTQNPIQKVDILNEISYTHRRTSPEKIMEYAKKAQQLSAQIQYKKGEAIAYKNWGIALYKMGSQRDSIVQYFQKAIHIAKEIEDYYTQSSR